MKIIISFIFLFSACFAGGNFVATSSQYLQKVVNFQSNDQQGTITAWVYLPTVLTSGAAIFSTSDTTATNNRFVFYFIAGDSLRLFTNAGGSVYDCKTKSVVPINQWNMVAIRSDGSIDSFFINGEPINKIVSTATNPGAWVGDMVGKDVLNIGAQHTTTYAVYFNGYMTDVRYYSMPKTDTDLKSLYYKGPGGNHLTCNADSLISRWNFLDGGNGSVMTQCIDQMGKNNLIPYNSPTIINAPMKTVNKRR